MRRIIIYLLPLFYSLILSCSNGSDYIESLKSPNIMVVNNAVSRLGEMQAEEAVQPLLELLQSAEDQHYGKNLKINIIRTLGNIGGSSSVKPLVNVLKNEDKEIQRAAIEALGKIQDPGAIPFLTTLIQDKDLQIVTIWALGNIKDNSALPVLTKLLDSEDKFVHYNVTKSLKMIGEDDGLWN